MIAMISQERKSKMKRFFLFLSILVAVSLACDVSVNIAPTNDVPATAETPVLIDPPTTTPEVFISLTQAIPAQVQLNGVTLAVQEAQLSQCDLPNCPPAPAGTHYLRVPLQALNLPTDQFLDYKNLPQGIAIHDNTGTITPFNRLAEYAPATQQLTLYFTVPETADVLGLQWPDTAEIPLKVMTSPISNQETAVRYEPLSFVIPADVASGASGIQLPRVDSEDAAWWQKTPGHLQVDLGDYYTLQGKSIQPQIFVYPAQEFAEMNPMAFESIHRLNNIHGDSGIPTSKDQLPAVPTFNSVPVFASNIQELSFRNGWGIRYLTQYAQYGVSVNNQELFYHYQGLTDDGAYYIVVTLPITAPGLPETPEAGKVQPIGGIAYPDYVDPNADWKGYYASATDLLNATPAEAFTPSLSQLDAMIQSIQVIP